MSWVNLKYGDPIMSELYTYRQHTAVAKCINICLIVLLESLLEQITVFARFGFSNIRSTYPCEMGPWTLSQNDDVIKWKHFPRYWPFVRGIHRSPVNSPRKGQWRGALMFSFICAWFNAWVNNREAGDLRSNRAHYDVIVMNIRRSILTNDLARFWMALDPTDDKSALIK